jgi:hypothetical protein
MVSGLPQANTWLCGKLPEKSLHESFSGEKDLDGETDGVILSRSRRGLALKPCAGVFLIDVHNISSPRASRGSYVGLLKYREIAW